MPQYFDSTAAFPMKSKVRKYASGGRVAAKDGNWIQSVNKSIKKKNKNPKMKMSSNIL